MYMHVEVVQTTILYTMVNSSV